jgi:hypothetical protein
MTDRALPMAFILIASFSSLLVWVCALVKYLPPH